MSAIVVVVLIVNLTDLTVHITRDQSNHSVAKQSNKYTLKLDTVQSDTNNKPVIHFDRNNLSHTSDTQFLIKLINHGYLELTSRKPDRRDW